VKVLNIFSDSSKSSKYFFRIPRMQPVGALWGDQGFVATGALFDNAGDPALVTYDRMIVSEGELPAQKVEGMPLGMVR
jgi:hypothetical protein